MKQGINYGYCEKAYHAFDAVNNSTLSKLAVCPAQVLAEDIEGYALTEGRAFHSLVLDGEEVFTENTIEADGSNLTKGYRELKAKFPNLTVLGSGGIELAFRLRDAIMSHPKARALVESMEKEVSALVKHPGTGMLCKARADLLDVNAGKLADLKFMRSGSADADSFFWNVKGKPGRPSYANQAGWYAGVFSAALKSEIHDFSFIVVEKESPFKVAVFDLDEAWLARGWEYNLSLLEKYAECKKLGAWPNYTNPGSELIVCPDYLVEA